MCRYQCPAGERSLRDFFFDGNCHSKLDLTGQSRHFKARQRAPITLKTNAAQLGAECSFTSHSDPSHPNAKS